MVGQLLFLFVLPHSYYWKATGPSSSEAFQTGLDKAIAGLI